MDSEAGWISGPSGYGTPPAGPLLNGYWNLSNWRCGGWTEEDAKGDWDEEDGEGRRMTRRRCCVAYSPCVGCSFVIGPEVECRTRSLKGNCDMCVSLWNEPRARQKNQNVHLLQPRPLIIIALIHTHTRLSIPRARRKREEFLELVHAREDDRVPERQQYKFAHVQARLTTTWRSVGRVAVPRASMRLARFAEGEEEWVCLEGEEYLDTKIEGTAFVRQL